MHNHYYDDTHPLRPYTHSLTANPGTVSPFNALRGEKPTAATGFWPGEQGGAWSDIEDHRGEEGYVNGTPFTVKDVGPLPEGWSHTPPPPTVEEQREAFTSAIQARLDDFARTRGYDGIVSAASYATSTHPVFRAEGLYAVAARDAAWAAGFAILAAVQAGERPMPTPEEAVAELPAMKWPAQAVPAEAD